MKLYFYEFNDGYYYSRPNGISVKEIEVIEKPKTFYPANNTIQFPQCMYFVRKEDIGELIGYNHNLVALTEPNFEKAKSIFEEYLKEKVEYAKKRLSDEEGMLKTLMDCEVAIND